MKKYLLHLDKRIELTDLLHDNKYYEAIEFIKKEFIEEEESNLVEAPVMRLKRELADRFEEYDSETFGQCAKCKKQYVRVNGSSCTNNTDKTRYREPDNFTAWNIFRCECGCVISDNFEAV